MEQVKNYCTNEKPSIDQVKDLRTCSVCGKIMSEGYFCEDDGTCYCSDECLHKEVSEEEYLKLYDEGFMFWTEWF